MKTLAQIKSLFNKEGTNKILKDLGFSLGPSRSWYYRYRGEFLDIMFIQRIAGGNAFRIHAYVTIHELVYDYDFNEFPDNFSEYLGNSFWMYVSPEGVDRSHYGWPLETDEESRETFETLNQIFSKKVDQWFKSINTRNHILSNVAVTVLEGNSGDLYKNVLNNA